MAVIAVVLTALTVLDRWTVGDLSHSSRSPDSPVDGLQPRTSVRVATGPTIGESTSRHTPTLTGKYPESPSAEQAWQNIRGLLLLNDNARAVAKRYQTLAVPYAEMMATIAVAHDADEKPNDAAKRVLLASLPPVVQIKALLIAEGAVSTQGNTILSVRLSLESADSQAMQQAVLALGNPAAGMVWRELTLIADSEKRVISLNGLLTVQAVLYAE